VVIIKLVLASVAVVKADSRITHDQRDVKFLTNREQIVSAVTHLKISLERDVLNSGKGHLVVFQNQPFSDFV
jgi:hypothetical protein